jgi:hypothetical protein
LFCVVIYWLFSIFSQVLSSFPLHLLSFT